MVWSPCGKFLAAGTVGGNLLIWDVEAKLCIERLNSHLKIILILVLTECEYCIVINALYMYNITVHNIVCLYGCF